MTMNYSFLQLFIVAQNEDVGKWVNILFVVVLAVFWAISGIVKAKAKQSQQQKKKQSPREATPGSQSVRRDPGQLILEKFLGSSGLLQRQQQRTQSQEPPKKASFIPPVKKRFTPKHKSISLKSTRAKNIVHTNAPIESNLNELPEFTTDAVRKVEGTRSKVPSEVSVSHYMLDFTGADSLKRAILYYEILGRPMSLRDTSMSVIGPQVLFLS